MSFWVLEGWRWACESPNRCHMFSVMEGGLSPDLGSFAFQLFSFLAEATGTEILYSLNLTRLPLRTPQVTIHGAAEPASLAAAIVDELFEKIKDMVQQTGCRFVACHPDVGLYLEEYILLQIAEENAIRESNEQFLTQQPIDEQAAREAQFTLTLSGRVAATKYRTAWFKEKKRRRQKTIREALERALEQHVGAQQILPRISFLVENSVECMRSSHARPPDFS